MRGSRALGLSLPFCLAAVAANGQPLYPSSPVAVPLVGHVFVETGLSAYRVDAFVERTGERQTFPGDLEFAFGLLRVSYSPLRTPWACKSPTAGQHTKSLDWRPRSARGVSRGSEVSWTGLLRRGEESFSRRPGSSTWESPDPKRARSSPSVTR